MSIFLRSCSIRLRRSAALALTLGLAIPAFASLGGNESSIESDRARMNAVPNVTQSANYAIHEIQSPSGVVVDEYLSSEGKVFAVTWHGQFMPDMQQVLGTYFSQYTAALEAQTKHYGHRPLDIEQPGFVVQTGGHMRAYYGRAYIADSLPQGIKADDIK